MSLPGPVPCVEACHWEASSVNAVTQVSAEGTERLASAAASADGRFVLTGGAKGLIVLRWLHSLQVGRAVCQRVPVLVSSGMAVSSDSHLGFGFLALQTHPSEHARTPQGTSIANTIRGTRIERDIRCAT